MTLRVATVLAIVLAGCGAGASQRGGPDSPDASGGVAHGAAATRSALEDELPPRVPALAPQIDRLDAAVVAIEAADDVATAHVRVADSPESRQRGLMHVRELPEDVGMLFVFDEPSTGGFWMKNTPVELQIAFLDGDGGILAIENMTACRAEPCPVYDPDVTYRAALEMPAGWFTDAGAGVGDRVAAASGAGRPLFGGAS